MKKQKPCKNCKKNQKVAKSEIKKKRKKKNNCTQTHNAESTTKYQNCKNSEKPPKNKTREYFWGTFQGRDAKN